MKNVIPVTELRNRDFGLSYGLRIVDGPLAGLLARAVVVLDEQGTVIFSKLVPELKTEPDYGPVLAVLEKETRLKMYVPKPPRQNIQGSTRTMNPVMTEGLDEISKGTRCHGHGSGARGGLLRGNHPAGR